MIHLGAFVSVYTAALLSQAEVAPDHDPGAGAPIPVAAVDPVENWLPPPLPPYFIEAAGRLSYRPAPASSNAGPPLGIGFGFLLGTRYLTLGDRVELGVAIDFAYAHHRKEVQGSRILPSGLEETFDGSQEISESTFGVLHVVNLLFARVRPWVGAGGGLGVGFFQTDAPSLRPGATRALRPYAQAAAGLHILLSGPLYLNVRADYHFMLSGTRFTTEAGESLQVLGNLGGLGVAFGSRLP